MNDVELGGSGATHYEILGVAPSATYTEIKRAFHALARQSHPDKKNSIPTKRADEDLEVEHVDTLTISDSDQDGDGLGKISSANDSKESREHSRFSFEEIQEAWECA